MRISFILIRVAPQKSRTAVFLSRQTFYGSLIQILHGSDKAKNHKI